MHSNTIKWMDWHACTNHSDRLSFQKQLSELLYFFLVVSHYSTKRFELLTLQTSSSLHHGPPKSVHKHELTFQVSVNVVMSAGLQNNPSSIQASTESSWKQIRISIVLASPYFVEVKSLSCNNLRAIADSVKKSSTDK